MATVHVKTTGNDSYTYAQAQNSATPWATIQKAVTSCAAGDTIEVWAGTYNEHVKIVSAIFANGSAPYNVAAGIAGTSGNPTTLKSHDPENPAILSGTTQTSGDNHQIKLKDISHFVIDGLKFYGYRGGGVSVESVFTDVQGVIIQNCHFDEQGTLASSTGANSHVINFIGTWGATGGTGSISYSHIRNNTIGNVITGPAINDYNEGVTLVGNVHHCTIDGNDFGNTSYLTVDLISKNTYYNGLVHHIIIQNNIVREVKVDAWNNNNAYKIDGADYVLFQNNVSLLADGGVSGSEPFSDIKKPLKSDPYKVHIHRNNIHDARGQTGGNNYGFFLGSDRIYAGASWNNGWVSGLYYVHNTIITESAGHPCIYWGIVTNLRLKNNIIAHVNNNPYPMLRLSAAESYFASELTDAGWEVGGNIYYTGFNPPYFNWVTAGSVYVGWAAYKAAKEPTSFFGMPTFASLSDYALASGSVGYEQGATLTTAVESKTGSTSLKVVDAGYFTGGWGLIEGELINIGSAQARVTDVDYDTNTLTLDTPCTWVAGAAVNYALSHGSTPTPGYLWTLAGADPIEFDPTPIPGQVLNTNPGFDSALTPWLFYSTGGDYVAAVAAGVCTITGTNEGSFTQLYQAPIALKAGVTYKVTLRAKASIALSVSVQFIKHVDPWNLYNATEINLTTDYQDYTYEFTASAADSNVRMRLQLFTQASSNSVYIDTFQIETAGETVVPVADTNAPADTTVNEGSNAVLTANFFGTSPTYQWFKQDGTQLANGAAYSGVTTAELTVLACDEADSGGYYCVATNSAGSAQSRTAIVAVIPAPEQGGGESGSTTVYATVDSYATSLDSTWGSSATELKVGHLTQQQGNSFVAQVNASGNDLYSNSGDAYFPGDGYLALGHLSSPYAYDNEVGIRVAVPHDIPQGATITNATIEMDMVCTTAVPSFKVYFEKYSNAAAWASAADFKGRTLTTAYVNWSPSLTGTYTRHTSVDISAALQEVVDAYALSAGSYVAVRIKPSTTGWPGSVIGAYGRAYDFNAANAPELIVSWETSATNDYNNEAGFMFTLDTAINSGVTVDTALFGIHAKYATAAPGFKVYVEKGSNLASWSGATDFKGRALSTAVVNWVPSLTGSYATYTVDIAPLIQELVNAYGGLANGAKIAVRIKPSTTGWPGSQQAAYIHSVEYNSASNEASLALAWSGSGQGASVWDEPHFGLRAGTKIGL